MPKGQKPKLPSILSSKIQYCAADDWWDISDQDRCVVRGYTAMHTGTQTYTWVQMGRIGKCQALLREMERKDGRKYEYGTEDMWRIWRGLGYICEGGRVVGANEGMLERHNRREEAKARRRRRGPVEGGRSRWEKGGGLRKRAD